MIFRLPLQFVVLTLVPLHAEIAAGTRPNIVLIYAADLGYGELHKPVPP